MLYPMFQNNRDESVRKWTHYFPVYERFLKDFTNKSVVMFEIGVLRGGSLRMWKKYLGPFATIVGIDINPQCARYEDDQCKVRIGKQGDAAFLKSLVQEFGTPDIVLDDGSHFQSDMNTTFKFLYPLLNNNGVYLVEDTHACYWEMFDGGLHKPDSFIETAKSLVDSLHAWHIPEANMVDDFTRSTFSISFFDSIIAFEKRLRQKPYELQIGKAENDGQAYARLPNVLEQAEAYAEACRKNNKR